MLMKGSGLPKAKTDPIEMVLFSLIGSIEGETIRAGMLYWFAAVHSFVEDEKRERASLLIGIVSDDFLHIESFLEVIPIFLLAPLPQFFQEKIEKGKKEKKETIRQ
jgi:hypothetical protein